METITLKKFKEITSKLIPFKSYISVYWKCGDTISCQDGYFYEVTKDNKLYMESASDGLKLEEIVSIDSNGVDHDWERKKHHKYFQDHHGFGVHSGGGRPEWSERDDF
jgi:hypothetical protein